MNNSEEAKKAIAQHVDALATLVSLLMRSAAGGTGAEKISAALLDAGSSLAVLEDAIDRKEVLDFGLCQLIASGLAEKAFPHDQSDFESLTDEGVRGGLRLAAHRMGGAMESHLARARRELVDWAMHYDERRDMHLRHYKKR